MRQFYIPTSSLNFNNIFSTESISPAAFYARRGFGYSRWTMIPENNVENAILLYDSPRNFTRPIGDLEDHPMLVEIRTDEEFPQYADGVFYSNHTIYLNPWNTRVWFFSDKDMRTAFSISDSSSETKLIRLYEKRISCGGIFDSSYAPIQDARPIELNTAAIDFDRKINRLKGLLYGYYIGAAKSVKPENAQLIHTLYVIQDTFAAIAVSPDKKATPSQMDVLKGAFEILRERNIFFQELVKITGSREKAFEVADLLERFKSNTPLNTISLEHHLSNLRYDQSADSSSLNWIKRAIDEFYKSTELNLLSPEKAEIVVIDNQLETLKIDEDKELIDLLKHWINGLFLKSEYNGKISSENSALSDDLTLAAREFIGDSWENSPIRAFLNNLRRLVNGEGISIDWNNGILYSVAAVIYKGDDWDKLLRFMQYQNMSDYRIAFAIYGQLNGFANLTRDFTDILLKQDGKTYLKPVYMEFHGQLFKQDILETPMPALKFASPATPAPISPKTTQVEGDVVLLDMKRRVMDVYRSLQLNYPDEIGVEATLMEVLLNYAGPAVEADFISYLAKQTGWKVSKDPLKSLKKALCAGTASKTTRRQTKTVNAGPKLEFPDDMQEARWSQPQNSMIEHFEWVTACESLIGLPAGREQFRKDALFVIDDHRNKKSQGEKSNDDIVRHLINLLKLKAKESKRDYSLAEIKDIEIYLKNKYGIR